MGRKAQMKRWRQVIAEAQRLEREDAKPPCATCAFVDPECWIADKAIGRKILTCLTTGQSFYCHHGMALKDGSYQPPLDANGQPDRRQMEPCGGFVRFAETMRQRSHAERSLEIMRLQRRFCERFEED